MDAVHVEGVRKAYGRIEALRGLSVAVPTGEIFGLLGANGAGKTTLIQIITGILRADSGQVRVLGFDPQREKQQLHPLLGYMPQQAALYDDLSARENVRFFGRARYFDGLAARVDEVLALLGLAERADDAVHTFSGGMKQRVSLACALVHRPRLLLLDEPTTGVDPQLRAALWEHLRTLARAGVTVLVSTHQMDEAFHCDRVAIMRAGEVLACDAPRSLLERGSARVTLWKGGVAQTHTLHHYREELPALLGIGAEVERVELHEDTLEDVVLKLIAEKEDRHA